MEERLLKPKPKVKKQKSYNTTHYWNWGDKEPIKVRADGVVDRKAITAFTQGQCHAFALALHEISGWPIVGLFNEWRKVIGGTPGHCAVKSPYGIVDIEGLGAVNRHCYGCVKVVSKERVLGFQNIDYMEPNVEVARPFARHIYREIITNANDTAASN
jgi:hypothetical protein